MEAPVGLLEIGNGQLGADLGGLDGVMPGQFLDVPQGRAGLLHVGGAAVADGMR